ncbi:MAG: S41 family peptidase, partial [Gemmatimonadaceae bacterium]|nr:S41 family peptidase [Gemmatimonadaceae bacterium]
QVAFDGSRVVFERDFGIWALDIASGAARPVDIALQGVAAGPATEHLTLTSGISDMAVSPDGKKVAVVMRGEVFAAAAKEGGEAARVTTTVAVEGQVRWASDSKRIVYTSDRNGPTHLFLYDFATRTESQLTNGAAHDVSPAWSPDGKSIAFIRGSSELRVYDVASRTDRLVANGTTLDRPPFVGDHSFDWSPDSRWIAFLNNGTKNFTNAYIVAAAGGAVRQASFVSNAFSSSIDWSRDGRSLVMQTGQRTEEGQALRIDLQPRAPRFREDLFRDLFTSAPGAPGAPAVPAVPAPPPAGDSARAARDTATRQAPSRAVTPVEIAWDGIRLRAAALNIGVDVGSALLSPDGKSLLVVGGAAGQTSLWTYNIDEVSRDMGQLRQLTTTPGNKGDAQWSADGTEVWFTEGGRLQAVNVATRAVRIVAVSAELDVDFAQEKLEVFDQAWTYLRDNFFDEKMNGADWNALRPVYRERVAGARTPDEMRRLMNLMIGELNASHTGMGGPPAQTPHTARIGLRFDRPAYEANGTFRVSDVVPLGPAAVAGGIKVGDVIATVDGTALSAGTNLEQLLAYKIGKQVSLGVVASPGGAPKEVRVRAIGLGAEKNLYYRTWVEERRAYVAKASGGKLGYAHMLDMGAGSLQQFHVDLDAENHAREGVVIDVRNNNGGFVNAYALDVLARRPYLTMQPRGGDVAPARAQLGQRALEKPTVLVTNQHSLSDAEDFTEGYRTLGLGQVVGEPTSGWIIYTSGASLIDGSSVRLPGTRIRDHEGKDMEMVPRKVDVAVRRGMGEWYKGVDTQLDAAVRVLLGR